MFCKKNTFYYIYYYSFPELSNNFFLKLYLLPGNLKELQSIYNMVKDSLYEDTSIHYLHNSIVIITNKIDLYLDELMKVRELFYKIEKEKMTKSIEKRCY